jgi:hypothetical protein
LAFGKVQTALNPPGVSSILVGLGGIDGIVFAVYSISVLQRGFSQGYFGQLELLDCLRGSNMINEVEAIALLVEGKPLVKQILSTRGLYEFTETELMKLRAVRKVCKAGHIYNQAVLQAAGVSMEDLAMLLGTLTFCERQKYKNKYDFWLI